LSALDLISAVTQIIYVLIFISVALQTIRRPTRAHADMTLFFGATAFIIVVARVAALIGTPPPWLVTVEIAILMGLPYILLRLVDDFTRVSGAIKRAAELGLAAGIVAAYAAGPTLATPVLLYVVGYFFVVSTFCAVAFIRSAHRSQGVTRRRMEAISLGSILLGTDILIAGLTGLARPDDQAILQALGQLLGLGSGVAYYLGFAPPPILRRAWQEPELRAFLARAASLPRLPSTLDIVRELERGASNSTGSSARIGLWQDDTSKLRFWEQDGTTLDLQPGTHFAGRVFEMQRPIFSTNPMRDNPDGAAAYRSQNIGAVLAAPITAGERRLGVLTFSAQRAPIFAGSDIELASLLADQAAVILESRALIDHAGRVKAREEATRLKEDFLSAAAHDLRTPLTTVVAQAEFLERRATREPTAPADIAGIRRIVRESKTPRRARGRSARRDTARPGPARRRKGAGRSGDAGAGGRPPRHRRREQLSGRGERPRRRRLRPSTRRAASSEPDRERQEVQSRADADQDQGLAGGWRGAPGRRGLWHRDPGRRSSADLRAILARIERRRSAFPRHGSGSVHLSRDRRRAWRSDLGGKRDRQGFDIPRRVTDR